MHLNVHLAKVTAFVAFATLSHTMFSSTGGAQTARVELHPIKGASKNSSRQVCANLTR
jgi:hypothetical protein